MKILFLVPPSKAARNVARDLVYGCWCKGKRIGGITFPPVSLLQVAAVLKEAGFKVALLDAAATQTPLTTVKRKAKNFDLVVVLTSTASVNEDAQILLALKKANPKLKTIVYGGHPTAMPKATLAKPGIDFIIRQEAERVLRDLVKALVQKKNWQKVRGIGFKKGKKIVINGFYPLIKDLDELPIPDRKMLPQEVDYFNPVVKRLPWTTAYTSRGCPGRCVFCSSPVFYGRRFRLQSTQRVLAELEAIVRQGYREVFFRDENFTVSKKRVLAICQGIREKELDLTWICSSRIDNLDKQMLREMKEAGCHLIRLGVESGSQKILDKIKKGVKVGQIMRVFRWTHEVGIDTHAHFMIGMPGETKQTVRKTIQFAKEIKPTLATFGICTPYPGTKLFDQVTGAYPEVADGSQADLSRLHTSAFYNQVFTKIKTEELGEMVQLAYRHFYFRLNLWWLWLKRLKSLDEFRRATLATAQVFDFIFRGDEPNQEKKE